MTTDEATTGMTPTRIEEEGRKPTVVVKYFRTPG